jgi:predicted Fe-S protein YdhL (DUF1289 family)
MRSSLLAVCAIVIAAGAASAQDQGGARGFLSPEQREMMRESRPHADWQAMTPEQRAAARDQMRAKWQSMSDSDKQALKAQLQAKWDALSPADKQAVEQKIAEHRSHMQQGQ